MSKEYSISIFKKGEEDTLFERLCKGHENLINLRKRKIFKRTQLIKGINNYYIQANNFKYLFPKKENKKLESFSIRDNFPTIKKSNDNNNLNKTISHDKFQIDINKNQNNKKKISNLCIDSYNKKVKYTFSNVLKKSNDLKLNRTFYKNIKKNKISINCKIIDNKNEEDDCFRNRIIKNIKQLNKDIKLNKNKKFKRKKVKSLSFRICNRNKKLLSYFTISSKNKIKGKNSHLNSDRRNNNNSTNDLNIKKAKNQKKSKFKSKSNSKIKYSNNYEQNCICKNILNHPNLRILYQTNEIRIKKMIKCQSKENKNKYTTTKYQNNLMKNTISPLNDELKIKLLKSFSKINNYMETEKKINLHKYLNEIQHKEKRIIKYHNKINEKYINNIEKMGLIPEKHFLKLEKIIFKDIFRK